MASALRTFLILGRCSNLPTVWSNCLAAWVLAGGGPWSAFYWLCGGAACLYLGMIHIQTVWALGFGLLGLGWLILAFLSATTAALALSLALAILLYNAVHKLMKEGALVMALCRALLYLVAASATEQGVNGLTIWSALVLGSYVAGLSFLATWESFPSRPPLWPATLMFPPLFLAFLINPGSYRWNALVLGLALCAWTGRNVWLARWALHHQVRQAVGGLLAGIILVDWLAVADQAFQLGPVFIVLFVAALLLQQITPASWPSEELAFTSESSE
jgi:hypothetical protein